jgi:hypothetical protein
MVAAAMRIPSPVFAAAVRVGLCAAPPAAANPGLTIACVTTAADGATVRRNRGTRAPSSPSARGCLAWETRG